MLKRLTLWYQQPSALTNVERIEWTWFLGRHWTDYVLSFGRQSFSFLAV